MHDPILHAFVNACRYKIGDVQGWGFMLLSVKSRCCSSCIHTVKDCLLVLCIYISDSRSRRRLLPHFRSDTHSASTTSRFACFQELEGPEERSKKHSWISRILRRRKSLSQVVASCKEAEKGAALDDGSGPCVVIMNTLTHNQLLDVLKVSTAISPFPLQDKLETEWL